MVEACSVGVPEQQNQKDRQAWGRGFCIPVSLPLGSCPLGVPSPSHKARVQPRLDESPLVQLKVHWEWDMWKPQTENDDFHIFNIVKDSLQCMINSKILFFSQSCH